MILKTLIILTYFINLSIGQSLGYNSERCGTINPSTVTTLSSPGTLLYSEYYSDLYCRWSITSTPGTQIKLNFISFITELRYDTLKVYDAQPKGNQVMLGNYSGTTYPAVLETNSNSIIIAFNTDSGTSMRGWSLSIIRETNTCGGQIDQTTTRLMSKNYPNNYAKNMNCIWYINATKKAILRLVFNDFITESMNDYLYVFDGDSVNSTLIGKFSGSSLPSDQTSSGNHLTIQFNTTNSIEAKGFDITIKKEILLSDTSFLISVKSGENSFHLYETSPDLSNINIIAENNKNSYKSMDYCLNRYIVIFEENTHQFEIHAKDSEGSKTIVRNVGKPNSIAIDCIHDLIYWIDSEYNGIKVVNYFKTESIATILLLEEYYSKNIIVNTDQSVLVWINIGKVPNIMQSDPDGENQLFIYRNSNPTKHLTIDYESKRYYFIIENIFTLISIDFSGINERIFIKSEKLFSPITNIFLLHEELFYTTEHSLLRLISLDTKIEKSVVIFKDDNFDSSDISYIDTDLKIVNVQNLYAFKMINPLLEPQNDNKCSKANCSHICVPKHNKIGFSCICPSDMFLMNHMFCMDLDPNKTNTRNSQLNKDSDDVYSTEDSNDVSSVVRTQYPTLIKNYFSDGFHYSNKTFLIKNFITIQTEKIKNNSFLNYFTILLISILILSLMLRNKQIFSKSAKNYFKFKYNGNRVSNQVLDVDSIEINDKL